MCICCCIWHARNYAPLELNVLFICTATVYMHIHARPCSLPVWFDMSMHPHIHANRCRIQSRSEPLRTFPRNSGCQLQGTRSKQSIATACLCVCVRVCLCVTKLLTPSSNQIRELSALGTANCSPGYLAPAGWSPSRLGMFLLASKNSSTFQMLPAKEKPPTRHPESATKDRTPKLSS